MDLEVICSHISWSVLNLWEKVIFLTGLLPAPRGGGPAVCSAPYRVIFIRGGCVHCQQLVLNSFLPSLGRGVNMRCVAAGSQLSVLPYLLI